ncbi:MAG: hypothetical protein ACR2KP_15730 [Egibacteraceae bacterium]
MKRWTVPRGGAMLGLAIVALVALGGGVLATAPSEPSLPGAE